VGWICSWDREERTAYVILIGNPFGNACSEVPRTGEHMYLRSHVVEWIELAQGVSNGRLFVQGVLIL